MKMTDKNMINKAESFYALLLKKTEALSNGEHSEESGGGIDDYFKLKYGITNDGVKYLERDESEKVPDGDFKITQKFIETKGQSEDYSYAQSMGFEYSPDIECETFAVVKEGDSYEVFYREDESLRIFSRLYGRADSVIWGEKNEQGDDGQLEE